MKYCARFALFLGGLVLLSVPAPSAQLASCAPDLSSCSIPENILLQLPFLAISGDVILLEPDLTTVSDVFRIFNDVVDTGGGTGLGDLVFLYSSDDTTPLPDPSTYSSNAVSILEDPSGVTHFIGNGTDYVLAAPEPSTFALLGLGLIAVVTRRVRLHR